MRKELLFATFAVIVSSTVYAGETFSLVDTDQDGAISTKRPQCQP